MCWQLCKACPIQSNLLLPLMWRIQRRPSWSSKRMWSCDSSRCWRRKSSCTKQTGWTTITVCWIFLSARSDLWNEFTAWFQHISSCRWQIRDTPARQARCEDSRSWQVFQEAHPAETEEADWTQHRRQHESSWTMGRQDNRLRQTSRAASGSSKIPDGRQRCKQNILFDHSCKVYTSSCSYGKQISYSCDVVKGFNSDGNWFSPFFPRNSWITWC